MDREIKENGHVMRNKRTVWEVAEQTVWEVATQRNPFNHFATFPESIVETCILAGCREGGLILDPFGGVGTTGVVAHRMGREADLIELNPQYAEIAAKRCSGLGQEPGGS
jgi:DNA modification methylase